MDYPVDYLAARNNAVFYALPTASQILISGQDRKAFVQRQTTNNINLLAAGRFQTSVLTSPMGRILDVFQIYLDGEGETENLVLLPLPGRGDSTLRYLKNRIFIMDKVSAASAGDNLVHYVLEGPQAGSVLARCGQPTLPAEGAVLRAFHGDHPIVLLGQQGFSGTGYRLLAPQSAAPDLEMAFSKAGAVPLSAEMFDILRIEAGQPGSGAELIEDYTPLETGLADSVAENKGCYTGQEVLARQVSYDKVTRGLIGLRMESPLPAGSAVYADAAPAGVITSSGVSPAFGPIALAILKRPNFEPGRTLAAGDKQQPITAVTCSLPFS